MSIVPKVGWKNKECGTCETQQIYGTKKVCCFQKLVDCRRKNRKGDPQVAFLVGKLFD